MRRSHTKLSGRERPSSAQGRAAALVHETEHARSWQDGGSTRNPMQLDDDQYVNTMLDEEARAESRAIRFTRELGGDRPGDTRSPSEASYWNAHRAGRQDALATGASPEEADRAGQEAGDRAVRADVPTWSNGTTRYDPYYRGWHRRAAFEEHRREERNPPQVSPPEAPPIGMTLRGLLQGGGLRA